MQKQCWTKEKIDDKSTQSVRRSEQPEDDDNICTWNIKKKEKKKPLQILQQAMPFTPRSSLGASMMFLPVDTLIMTLHIPQHYKGSTLFRRWSQFMLKIHVVQWYHRLLC